jgi:hypothetical protein
MLLVALLKYKMLLLSLTLTQIRLFKFQSQVLNYVV